MSRSSQILRSFMLWCALLLILLPMCIPSKSLNSHEESPQLAQSYSFTESTDHISILSLDRNVVVDDYGLITTQDTIEFFNNQSDTVSTLYFCLSEYEDEHLIFANVFNNGRAAMIVERLGIKINNYSLLAVVLNKPILPYSYITIQLRMVFKDTVTYNPYSQYYAITFPLFPINPYFIDRFDTIVHIPGDSTVQNIQPSTYYAGEDAEDPLTHSFSANDVPSFSKEEVMMVYHNQEKEILRFKEIKRTITVNPWGYIEVEEEHWIVNYGAQPVVLFFFNVPGDIMSFNASDTIGEIIGVTVAVRLNADGTKSIFFNLGNNRAVLLLGNTMYYRIKYQLPIKNYTTTEFGLHNIKLDLYTSKSEYLMEKVSTKLILKSVSRIDRINLGDVDQTKEGEDMVFKFVTEGVCKYHGQIIDISYRVNGFAMFQRVFLFSALFMIIFSFYVVVQDRRKTGKMDVEILQTRIPVQELNQFVKLYEEKNAILIEMEKSDMDLLHRRISKKGYQKNVDNYTQKLKEVEVDLDPFKKALFESNPDIRNIIQRLDYLEAEKTSIKDSIVLLTDRYKKGKLPSKAAFDKLSSDLMRRMESAQQKIDRYINELRAFLI